jgi:hypothetical protein
MTHIHLAHKGESFQGWEIAMNTMNKQPMNALNKQLQITKLGGQTVLKVHNACYNALDVSRHFVMSVMNLQVP